MRTKQNIGPSPVARRKLLSPRLGPHSGGRKLARHPGGAVITLINLALDKLQPSTLRAVGVAIDYPERNVWAVYHGKRGLPLQPTLRLCKFLEIPVERAVEAYETQKTERDLEK